MLNQSCHPTPECRSREYDCPRPGAESRIVSYWDSIEAAYKEVSIHDGGIVFCRDFARLPAAIGDLVAVHWTLSEVANGGLHQFFLNSTGVLAPETAQGFYRMGLGNVGNLIRTAMSFVGETSPREQADREPFLMSNSGEVFQPLEKTLYEIGSPNLDHIYDVMDEYAKRTA
jgi:hypothetical protein